MFIKSKNFLLFNKVTSTDFINIENTFNLQKLNFIFLNWNLKFFRYRNSKYYKNLNLYNKVFMVYFSNLKKFLFFFNSNLELFNSKLNFLHFYLNGYFLNLNYFYFTNFLFFNNKLIFFFFFSILNIFFSLISFLIFKVFNNLSICVLIK